MTHLLCVNVISSQEWIQKLSWLKVMKTLTLNNWNLLLSLDFIFSLSVWNRDLFDTIFVSQIIFVKTLWRAANQCSNCARPCHGANSWGWDAHSFSSVYHAGKGFQKLLSHKNSMHLNATAHFQSQVIFCDNALFFVSTVRSRGAPDRTFTGNYPSSALVKLCL